MREVELFHPVWCEVVAGVFQFVNDGLEFFDDVDDVWCCFWVSWIMFPSSFACRWRSRSTIHPSDSISSWRCALIG